MRRQVLSMFAIDTAFLGIEVRVRGIDLRTFALTRAILTAPMTFDKYVSLSSRLISTFQGVLASR